MKFYRPQVSSFVKVCAAWFLNMSGIVPFACAVRTRLLKKHFIGILAYHHVSPRRQGLISPVQTSVPVFSRHVSVLTRQFKVMRMREVVDSLKESSKLSKDGLVFTFDDGYRDAFEHAAPILAANNIRGVFYVTAAPFCWQNILWNDVVGEFCETVTPADATAVVAVSPEIREMVKNVAVRGEKERKAPSEKLFLSLLDMDQEERESIVADFRTVLDKKKHEFAPSRLLMSGAQIAALASRGHEIGAHTVSHSRLSRSAGRAGREIVESVRELRSAGIPVSSFAYPFGRAEDIDPQQTSVLSQAGISNAVTTEKDLVAQGANHFLLPRITVLPYHTVSFIVALFELLAWKRLCVSFLFRKQASSLTTVRVAQARQ